MQARWGDVPQRLREACIPLIVPSSTWPWRTSSTWPGPWPASSRSGL